MFLDTLILLALSQLTFLESRHIFVCLVLISAVCHYTLCSKLEKEAKWYGGVSNQQGHISEAAEIHSSILNSPMDLFKNPYSVTALV